MPMISPRFAEPIELQIVGYCVGNGEFGGNGQVYKDDEYKFDPKTNPIELHFSDGMIAPGGYNNLVIYVELSKHVVPAFSLKASFLKAGNANVKTQFTNNDYETIEGATRSTGAKNFSLDRTQTETIYGPEGQNCGYAWKPNNVNITDAEYDSYAAMATTGMTSFSATHQGKSRTKIKHS
jgi:hypothetical protein